MPGFGTTAGAVVAGAAPPGPTVGDGRTSEAGPVPGAVTAGLGVDVAGAGGAPLAPGTGRALVFGSCLLVGVAPGAGWPRSAAVAGGRPVAAGAVEGRVVAGRGVAG